jgi:hypothetical protein
MKLLKHLLALVLLAGVVTAAVADCEVLVEKEKFVDAGDCFLEEEEWGKCVYYYLKYGRQGEIAWNRNQGDPTTSYSGFVKATKWYNPETASLHTCLAYYGDDELEDTLEDMFTWLSHYSTTPVDPPHDMGEVLESVEADVFASPEPEPEPEPVTVLCWRVQGETCVQENLTAEECPLEYFTTESTCLASIPEPEPVVPPVNQTNQTEEDEGGGDMTMIVLLVLIVLVFVAVVAGVAVALKTGLLGKILKKPPETEEATKQETEEKSKQKKEEQSKGEKEDSQEGEFWVKK